MTLAPLRSLELVAVRAPVGSEGDLVHRGEGHLNAVVSGHVGQGQLFKRVYDPTDRLLQCSWALDIIESALQ